MPDYWDGTQSSNSNMVGAQYFDRKGSMLNERTEYINLLILLKVAKPTTPHYNEFRKASNSQTNQTSYISENFQKVPCHPHIPTHNSPFLTLLIQTSFAPTGAAPVHPPSHTNTVFVCVSEYVVVAGKLAGQSVSMGAQLVIVLVLTTTAIETVVLVTCSRVLVVWSRAGVIRGGISVGRGGGRQPPGQL